MDAASIKYLTQLEHHPGSLSPRAAAFADAVARTPFAGLFDFFRGPAGQDVVAFVADIEVPQYPMVDIRREEPVAVQFDPEDIRTPEVLMLREDFPKLPHRILTAEDRPVSLCIYEVPFSETKTFWTGPRFLSRIREWLKLTAVGELHQSDQPLEPLLLDSSGVIIYEHLPTVGEVFFYSIGDSAKMNFYARPRPLGSEFQRVPIALEWATATPQVHGVIERTPSNLEALYELLYPVDINVKEIVEKIVRSSQGDDKNLARKLMIWVTLPKFRGGGDVVVQDVDQYVFFINKDIRSIGVKLGLWDEVNSMKAVGWVIGAEPRDSAYGDLPVSMLRPISMFNTTQARAFNGVPTDTPAARFMAIGAGALGSQILVNIARGGLGTMKIVDKDIVMPHNLARHVLSWRAQMSPKAEALAAYINEILPWTAESLVWDVLQSPHSDTFVAALEESSVYLDFSASTPVLRALSASEVQRRTISCFMSPTGNDVVAIVQDAGLSARLSDLEIQYLRLIFRIPALHDHLLSPGGNIRYGGGCSEVSAVIPQDSVAFAAAIGSKAIRKALESPEGFIKVWRLDPDTLTPTSFGAPIFPTRSFTEASWEVRVDKYMLGLLRDERRQKLPNETGGILVGTYDMVQRIIYVGDIIPSPDDSHEYPTAYIRGVSGVRDRLDEYQRVLGGAFTYIGEWHSHPDGVNTDMSPQDKILFRWLEGHMAGEGLPALMGIIGQNDNISFYVK
jgi:Prokaryotic E2 family A/ThiF family/Prokaryotic homologs of the JAB domain